MIERVFDYVKRLPLRFDRGFWYPMTLAQIDSNAMSANLRPVFTNPDIAPDDALIGEALNDAFAAWQGLEEALRDPAFGLSLSWAYYKDGGWLCKALRGKKNMAWLAVWRDCATMTFYFAARHREDLTALPIPENLQSQIAEVDMIGKMLPFVIRIESLPDVAPALEVLRYKLRAK